MEQVFNEAKAANKYAFIWDKQGNVGTFMQYKGHLCTLAPEIIKVGLGQQTNEGVGEVIRKHFVNAMRNGDRLCIDVESCKPAWGTYDSAGTFDSNLFFNWAAFAEASAHEPYVREDENHGIGGLN